MLFLRTAASSCRALAALRCLTGGYSVCRGAASYIQGQSPESNIREYFYFIDHQGQLFLDDTKVKNFVTCFKDKQFLVFFFSRLRLNRSGRYEEDFPFLSLCGRERNFLCCDDRPVVFTHLLQSPAGPQGPTGEQQQLSYCGGEEKLTVPFQPEALYMHPTSGRVYHPSSERSGGVGLIRSALAIELSSFFVYPPESGQAGQPTHFLWRQQKHTLTNELARYFPAGEEGNGQQGELE
uniref:Chromosome 8 open reading frame 82 n=1 Tax=Nothobranchius rachovii TaxID=451742 RepID=A0A1A8Q5C6_9TELE